MSASLTIDQKIEEIVQTAAFAFDMLPGVVIINSIADGKIEYISKRGEQLLGISREALRQMTGQEYFSRFFNHEEAKDYVPQIINLLLRNNDDEVISYFQQVRIVQSSQLQLYATTSKIFFRDEEGKPLLIITLSMPLDPNNHLTTKAKRLIEENSFLRNNKNAFASLTNREKEILQLIATGKTPEEIAEQLYISTETVKTHRRNIKAKLKIQNNYEFTRFAQAFDLI